MRVVNISPQSGPQAEFLSSLCDIVIYGGSAGSGKSYALLLEPLRHYHNGKFDAVIFRKTTPQITSPGALWDTASEIYSIFGAIGNKSTLTFEFASGMKVKFSHLEHEKNIYDWQGSQLAMIAFDELTHFSEKEFFYLMSRNRSASGVAGYIRATTNPSNESWVREFLDYWIGEDGFPDPRKSGSVRWFIRKDNNLIWSNHKHSEFAKSVTFISAKLSDNKILMEKDPGYLSNLEALPYIDRMRLLEGNWNVKPAAGNYFKPHYFEIIDAMPTNLVAQIRYWDRASSTKKGSAFTVGTKMHKTEDGQYIISDVQRFQGTPLTVKNAVKTAAVADTVDTAVGIEHDPGQAGDYEAQDYVRHLSGFEVKLNKVNEDKITRAKPYSAQCENGNVKLLRGPWNKLFIDEHAGFPDLNLKDQVDSASGAFRLLNDGVGTLSKKFVTNRGRSKHVRHEDYE